MSKNTIFPDTQPFNKTIATELQRLVNSHLLSLGISSVKVGSNKEILNDLDLQVDLAEVAKSFGTDNDKDTRVALQEYFAGQGFQTKRNGINVFVRMPLANSAHQIDLEVINNVDEICRYHQHDIPEGSPFKGVSKMILIGTLAKDNGFMFSAWEGLFIRTADNKKGPMYAINWDDIAMILLGPNACGADLACVETVLAKLPNNTATDLLARCRLDKAWFEDISCILA